MTAKKKLTIKEKSKLFEDYIKKYMDYFGMVDYQINFDSVDDTGCRAKCQWHYMSGSQMFTFCWSTNWLKDKKTDEKDIKRTAFHEVLEAMFSKLRDYSENIDKVVTEREIDCEIHRVIRTMENKILHLIKI